MAAYVTRSSLELQQLCRAMGGEPQTISGLSGVGDLMLTAFGEMSRNRTLGRRLVQGETLELLTAEMTVEGVPTAQVAVHLGDRCGLELPIFRAVASILSGEMTVQVTNSFHCFRAPFPPLPSCRKLPCNCSVGPDYKRCGADSGVLSDFARQLTCMIMPVITFTSTLYTIFFSRYT